MEQPVSRKRFEVGFNAFLLLFAFIIVISSFFNLVDTDRNMLYAIVGIMIGGGSVIRLYKLKKNT
ncbi:hypothetical protein JCM9140_2777 [Halalkalibacter wakoensis JCM 9140]|uniref:Uncharacterized protein n=1 Tax=Halalkalibacter wakoensis JCM 9140 TaxID=1236970 RepID=W4Q405_9BACI|nr:hypothetical protein [Halalkalibacter wakoensis]GAE26690.1 hypothetical protein JCM9140_2777 [Halalkalibacter wakoensis JCM 9140]